MARKPTNEYLEQRIRLLEEELIKCNKTEELRESEEKYRQLAMTAHDAIITMNFEGIITYANPAAINLARGLDVVGMSIKDFIPPELVSRQIEMTEARRQGYAETISYELPLISSKDGSILFFDTKSSLLMEKSKPSGILLVARDITERKHVESEREEALKALKENDIFLKETQKIARVGGWKANPYTDYLEWTDGVYDILEVSRDYKPGLTEGMKYYPSKQIPAIKKNISDCLETGKPFSLEVEVVTETGKQLWTEVRGFAPVANGERSYVMGTFQDITDHQREKELLFEQQNKLSSIFRAAPVGIGMVIDRVLQEANDMLSQMTGYSREEILGQNARMLYPTQEDYDFVGKEKYRQIGEKNTGTVETRWKRKDGKVIDIILSSTPLDPANLTKGVTFTALDITYLKEAQEALQENEQNYCLLATYHKRLNDISIEFTEASDTEDLFNRIAESLRLLTNAIAATFSIYNQETKTLKVVSLSTDPISHGMASSIFGPELFEMRMPVSADEMEHMLSPSIRRLKDLSQLSFGVIPQEISDALMDAVGCRQIVALAISYDEELIGTCVAYLPGDQPVVPDDALKTYMYLSAAAIKRKQAVAELRESEERLRNILESVQTGIMIIDPETHTIVDINQVAARMIGTAKEKIMGNICHKFVCPSEKGKCPVTDLENVVDNAERILICADGNIIPIIKTVIPIMLGGKRHLLESFINISDRKRAEAEREKLQQQLTQAQKMESIGRLAGGVAHDFNNMLGVILGHAEMALLKVTPESPLYIELKDIQKAAERSADLTRQLLAFARKQTIAPKVLDLNDTVEGMLKMLQRLIGEDIALTWLPGENIWPVQVDPSQIDQILANLCVNARDAIAGAGKIIIETGTAVFDEAYCDYHVGFVPGDYVLLIVSDNGCGMDRETQNKLFEPFFTTKGVGKGTGLGLSTVYGIVKQNDGFIYVYSEPGHGTTFKILLPRHVGKTEQIQTKGSAADTERGHETILLVEDEQALLEMATMMLENLGYRALPASTPGKAIQLAEQHAGEIHILMTDIVMPEMNGRALAKRLMSLYPDLKCLFMSGYTANVIAHQGVLEEGVKFIQKPFSMKDLAAKLREAIDNG